MVISHNLYHNSVQCGLRKLDDFYQVFIDIARDNMEMFNESILVNLHAQTHLRNLILLFARQIYFSYVTYVATHFLFLVVTTSLTHQLIQLSL